MRHAQQGQKHEITIDIFCIKHAKGCRGRSHRGTAVPQRARAHRQELRQASNPCGAACPCPCPAPGPRCLGNTAASRQPLDAKACYLGRQRRRLMLVPRRQCLHFSAGRAVPAHSTTSASVKYDLGKLAGIHARLAILVRPVWCGNCGRWMSARGPLGRARRVCLACMYVLSSRPGGCVVCLNRHRGAADLARRANDSALALGACRDRHAR